MLETWVLITWLFVTVDRFERERTPGLSEDVCKELAEQVDWTQGFATCIRWGAPRPHWPPGFERPKKRKRAWTPWNPSLSSCGSWWGQRFEQTEIPNLSRQDCVAGWLRIGSDRELVKTQCVAQCADCGQLPKRLEEHDRWAKGKQDEAPPKSVVICPTWPPCWRDGKPIKGVL
jgi:hypothetical protein